MSPPHTCRLLLAVLALAASSCAWAEGADDLRFRVAEGVVHDSNLFRLQPNANALALIGRSSGAETIGITTLGVNYNRAYSLQRVEFDLNYNNYRYQNFDYLNFSAFNYSGAWRWSYTPHLYGNLTTSRSETLNSFADFQGFNQRNVRKVMSTRADATYEVDANWRALAGVTHSTLKNNQQLTQEGDYSADTVDAGVSYVLPSGSSATYTIRSSDGTYINRPLPSFGLFDNGYTQTDNEVQLNWAISRDTLASFRAGHRSRTHPNYPQRDFSGMIGGANLNWNVSAKSLFTVGWTRELATYETFSSNFSQIDRFSIGPVWQVSPKTTVRLQFAQAIYDYKGAPFGFTGIRRDTTRDASLGVDWQPFSYLLLNASLQNARRASNQPGLDFNSNIINLTAQFTY